MKDNETVVTNEHDLLLYFDDKTKDDVKTTSTTSTVSPTTSFQVNVKNVEENMQYQHDNVKELNSNFPAPVRSLYSSELDKVRMKMKKFPHNNPFESTTHSTNMNRISFPNKFHQNDDGIKSNQMKNTANQIEWNQSHKNQGLNQKQNRLHAYSDENRFSINQDEIGPNERASGVINHHLYGHDTRNYASTHHLMNENGNYLPNEIDVRVKFGNHQKHLMGNRFEASGELKMF